MSAERPRAGLGRKLLLLAGSVVVALLLLEAGLQLAALVFRAFRDDGRAATAAARGADEFRVLCLGESTTEGYGETPYTEFLEQLLNERGYGPRFRVINAGFVAEHSSDLLRRLDPLIAQHDPQVLIVMMGVNDPLYFSTKARLGIPLEWQLTLYKSRLYRLLSIAHHGLRQGRSAGVRAYDGPRVYPAHRAHRREFVRRFEEYYEKWAAGALQDAEARFRELIEMAREVAVARPGAAEGALEVPPAYLFHYYNAYDALQEILLAEGRPAEAVELYEEALRRHPDSERFRRALAGIHQRVGDAGRAREQLELADALARTEVLGITRANFRELVRVMESSDIQLVAMQYPLRRVSQLQYLLGGSADVVYVDNEANFRAAVAAEGYEAYFTDRFAGDFGHCTAKGNRLIAENLMTTVFEPLFADRVEP